MLKHLDQSQGVVVRFEDVSLTIGGKPLIRNISCTLAKDGITIVLGPNGAGKSLFLRLMAGLLEPTGGRIVFNDNQDKSSQDNCQTLVFQNPVLLRRSTFDNMAFVLRRQRLSKDALNQKVMRALQDAQLENHADTPARKLSGGEQQRLAMARALVVSPPALLLDEPTASLDPASTFVIEDLITGASSRGTKIILVTHDIKQAKRLADDIVFIHEGKIVAQNGRDGFFREPGSEQAQSYLDGRMPV